MGRSMNSQERYTKDQLIAIFLFLWGATFFFDALSGLIVVARGSASSTIIETSKSFAEIGCTIVLIMLGLKILEKEE